jgi:membrane associated rhomboid family serine protease
MLDFPCHNGLKQSSQFIVKPENLNNRQAESVKIGSGGGIAWFAHIGGFVAGLCLVHFFKKE